MVVKREGGGDLLVKTLTTGLFESKGSHAHTWLGDSQAGLFVPSGEYIGVVSVGQHRYESTVSIFHY
jgi:hypothetical protein